MFIDSRTIPENTVVETDVCIIGAGAAGITLALELNKQQFRVCLLESGGFDFDKETQSLYQGQNIGLDIALEGERARYFGGTTNLWGGFCRPMDEEDFDERDWIPHSGWPFTRAELMKYYERAHEICHLGPLIYDINAWGLKERLHVPDNGRVITKLFQISPKLRFGEIYREEIRRSINIRTYLFANVTDIVSDPNSLKIRRVKIATLAGNGFWLSAKLFVLAAGAIENARLLLISNKVQSGGLGNQNDLVGRYFMAHLELDTALWVTSAILPMMKNIQARLGNWEGRIMPLLALSARIRQQEKLPNFTAEFGIGVAATDELAPHISRVLEDDDARVVTLTNASETVPNPNSRITLIREKDRLGTNRVSLDWQVTPTDRNSLERSYAIVGRELARAGLGRLKLLFDGQLKDGRVLVADGALSEGQYWSQHHHMGTTRMHMDPKKGVVTPTCQVHGIANLFIAGGSVFPTSSSATPTLTIIALAVRLADHIKDKMR